MIEAAAEALTHVASLQYIGWVALGTVVGLLVGVIPGLGGVTGMSLLLPFIFGMDPFAGLALLMGMAAVVHTSDTFPSVLIGLPGSAGSQATIMDGYPLARQGQAERALGAAFMVSMVGGFIGAAVLLGTIVIIRPVVLALGCTQKILTFISMRNCPSQSMRAFSVFLAAVLMLLSAPKAAAQEEIEDRLDGTTSAPAFARSTAFPPTPSCSRRSG